MWIDGFKIDLPEEVLMVKEAARSFAQNEVLPLAKKIDQEHYFPAASISTIISAR